MTKTSQNTKELEKFREKLKSGRYQHFLPIPSLLPNQAYPRTKRSLVSSPVIIFENNCREISIPRFRTYDSWEEGYYGGHSWFKKSELDGYDYEYELSKFSLFTFHKEDKELSHKLSCPKCLSTSEIAKGLVLLCMVSNSEHYAWEDGSIVLGEYKHANFNYDQVKAMSVKDFLKAKKQFYKSYKYFV